MAVFGDGTMTVARITSRDSRIRGIIIRGPEVVDIIIIAILGTMIGSIEEAAEVAVDRIRIIIGAVEDRVAGMGVGIIGISGIGGMIGVVQGIEVDRIVAAGIQMRG